MSNTIHRRSRSIEEIIDAVVRSKLQWQSKSSPFDEVSYTSITQKRRLDADSHEDKAYPIALPQAPTPSASRQEHHRYFYALRKATRQRKQQTAAAAATGAFGSANTIAQPAETTAATTIAAPDQHALLRSPSSASSLSPTACRACSTISESSISTVAPDSSNSAPKTSYAAVLAAWQRTPDDTIFARGVGDKRVHEEIRCFRDMLIDDDRKEVERLFDELNASLYMQHAELLCNDF